MLVAFMLAWLLGCQEGEKTCPRWCDFSSADEDELLPWVV